MTKKLPILKRLEVALGETTSESEKDIVYGLLGLHCFRMQSANLTVEEFYNGINHRTFSVIENRRDVTSDIIKDGKEIANYIRNCVNLPEKGEKGYRLKMLQAYNYEFNMIKKKFN